MVGQGSVNHNSRAFNAKNTDPERSHLNITYCHENIKTVFHELFDEALKRYNDKQTRADRKIEDYYEKIRSGKQEKPFHEIILQVGNKDDMSAEGEDGHSLRVAGSEGKYDGAAHLLVRVAGVNAQTNMEFEAFVKLRRRAFFSERYGFRKRILFREIDFFEQRLVTFSCS